MTQLQETVCFENTSSLEDPIFSSPAGKLSLRQAIILGLGCTPILLYVLSTFDFVFLPLILIPLVIGIPRPKILSMDQLTLSLILFYVNGPSIKSKNKKKKTYKQQSKRQPSSKFLGTQNFHLQEKQTNKQQNSGIREIKIHDFKKAVNLKLNLHNPNGLPFENHFVEIYLDDKRIGAMTTDSAGQIVATFVPESPGDKKLKIYADKYDTPILDEIVSFSRE